MTIQEIVNTTIKHAQKKYTTKEEQVAFIDGVQYGIDISINETTFKKLLEKVENIEN